MSAIHPFLNTITTPNAAYFDRLFDEAENLINDATTTITKISDNALAPIDFAGTTPSLTDPTAITIGTLPTVPTAPILSDVPIDTMPTAPSLTMSLVATDNLLSTTISNIIAQIQNRITYATGLSPAVEAAIFGRGRDRETRTMLKTFSNFIASVSSKGWTRPAGAEKSALITLDNARNQAANELSREIMNKQAELEQSNIQQNLTLYQSLNQQLAAMKTSDEANKIGLYGVSIDSVIKKAQVYISVNQSYVDTFASEVQAYAALSSTTLEEAKFRTAQIEALNAMNMQLSQNALEKLKILSEYDAQVAGLANEAAKAISAVMGQLAATLMNAINISQTFANNKAWDYGETRNY
jgi:hypothetical protein